MASRKNVSETIREEGVNVHLAQLLRNRGISARAERRSREGMPDLRADWRSGDLAFWLSWSARTRLGMRVRQGAVQVALTDRERSESEYLTGVGYDAREVVIHELMFEPDV